MGAAVFVLLVGTLPSIPSVGTVALTIVGVLPNSAAIEIARGAKKGRFFIAEPPFL